MLVAIVGSALAIFGIVWYWIDFLNALANWILPLAAILIAELYIVRKAEVRIEPPKNIRVEGVIAWLVGGAVSYLLTSYAPYFVPSLTGFFTAMVIYLLGRYLTRGR